MHNGSRLWLKYASNENNWIDWQDWAGRAGQIGVCHWGIPGRIQTGVTLSGTELSSHDKYGYVSGGIVPSWADTFDQAAVIACAHCGAHPVCAFWTVDTSKRYKLYKEPTGGWTTDAAIKFFGAKHLAIIPMSGVDKVERCAHACDENYLCHSFDMSGSYGCMLFHERPVAVMSGAKQRPGSTQTYVGGGSPRT